eukprot:TRINITY_DN364_c0_g1_i4.p1 TRINITY_DN364_c0_g1~~TRINITY_DN364_c0_g1_i4.p1  ORF type:complete len:302 (+),score=69.58 TRINITY_DN364_c0_g1_i4:117-1022(+)
MSAFQAVVYTHSDHQTRQVVDKVSSTTRLLIRAGIPGYAILVTNVAHDYKLQRWLHDQSNGRRGWPQIYIGDVRIGFFDDLEEAQYSGLLALLTQQNLTSSLKPIAQTEPDCAPTPIEEEEYIQETEEIEPISNIKDYEVTSWITAAQWTLWAVFGTSNPESKNEDASSIATEVPVAAPVDTNPAMEEVDLVEDNADDDQDAIEIKLNRVNWYWSHQERIFRFKGNSFERIDPGTSTVRATFKYDTVETITKSPGNYLVIKFNDGSEVQHLTGDSEEKINQVIDLIRTHASDEHREKIIVN